MGGASGEGLTAPRAASLSRHVVKAVPAWPPPPCLCPRPPAPAMPRRHRSGPRRSTGGHRARGLVTAAQELPRDRPDREGRRRVRPALTPPARRPTKPAPWGTFGPKCCPARPGGAAVPVGAGAWKVRARSSPRPATWQRSSPPGYRPSGVRPSRSVPWILPPLVLGQRWSPAEDVPKRLHQNVFR